MLETLQILLYNKDGDFMTEKNEQNTETMMSNDYELHHFKRDIPPSMDFHSHDFYEIYFFVDGTVTYCIEEKTFELMNGDVLIIPPGKLHKPIVTDNLRYERSVLWLSRDYLNKLDASVPSIADEFRKMRAERNLLISLRGIELKKTNNLLSEIDSEIALHLSNEHTIVSSYITILLNNLIRISKSQLPKENLNENESIVPSIIEYINAHLSEQLSSDIIAEKFYLSKYHLHHIFKNYTNVSLYDYILSKRIILAKSLIRHGSNLTDTCFNSGFKDYSTFYKTFISKAGISPRDFKKSITKK